MYQQKIYQKDESFDPIFKARNNGFVFKVFFGPFFLVFLGVLVLVWQVFLPLYFFKTQDKVAKPISSSVLGVASGFSEFEFEELQRDSFSSETENPSLQIPEFFYLSIPKLIIEDAAVEINSTNFDPVDSLGHYKGTSLPGENGNAFIYGHSVFKWFYNPKNYKTMFTTLDDLTLGDSFYITLNDVTYKYRVISMKVLSPEEVDPLARIKPEFLNSSTATLMTCSPPGTRINRLLVIGEVTDIFETIYEYEEDLRSL